jgi:hypothetical protein
MDDAVALVLMGDFNIDPVDKSSAFFGFTDTLESFSLDFGSTRAAFTIQDTSSRIIDKFTVSDISENYLYLLCHIW